MNFLTKDRLAGFALNCVLFLCALVVSLFCAEGVFLAYERAHFSSGYVDEYGIVNLESVRKT